MCLDIDYHYNNQNLFVNSNNTGNLVEMETETQTLEYKLNVRSLCGGSLIDHKPIFDPKGQ